jgi:hypothetical protein
VFQEVGFDAMKMNCFPTSIPTAKVAANTHVVRLNAIVVYYCSKVERRTGAEKTKNGKFALS